MQNENPKLHKALASDARRKILTRTAVEHFVKIWEQYESVFSNPINIFTTYDLTEVFINSISPQRQSHQKSILLYPTSRKPLTTRLCSLLQGETPGVLSVPVKQSRELLAKAFDTHAGERVLTLVSSRRV